MTKTKLPTPKWPGKTTKAIKSKEFGGDRMSKFKTSTYGATSRGKVFGMSEGGKQLQGGYSEQSSNTRKQVKSW